MKNKTLALLLSFIIIFSLFFEVSCQLVYAMDKGDGTKENPYKISDYYDLQEFAKIVNGDHDTIPQNNAACGILTNDIDAKIDNWIPIGDYKKAQNKYKGIFDGNNKVIKGLQSSYNKDYYYIGLFGYIATEGILKNVSLKNSDIHGCTYVGNLAGWNEGIIYNCNNSGKNTSDYSFRNITGVSTRGYASGGITGKNLGKIISCSNKGTVISKSINSGGLTGENQGIISDSYNFSLVSGIDECGGVSGSNYGSIVNCYNNGPIEFDINAINTKIGGISGINYGELTKCYNTGVVDGYNNTGGIAGFNIKGIISYCLNTQNVSGTDENIGGITGCNDKGTITYCYNTKDITGEKYVGGISADNTGSIKFSYNRGNIYATVNYNAGIAAFNNGDISNSYNTGTISGNDSGGLVAANHGLLINSYNCGAVSGNSAGGLINLNTGTAQNLYYDSTILSPSSAIIYNSGNTKKVTSLTTKEMTGKNCKVYKSWENFEDNWALTDSYPVLKALTHKLEKIHAKAASCTEDGNNEYYVCSYCGKYYKDEEATCEIQKDDFVLKATGHQWDKGIITKKATEKSTGIKTYTCSLCNAKRTEIIKKLSPSTTTNILFANAKTSGETGLIIKWNKIKNASGYEIYLEKYQNKKKNKTYKKVKAIRGNKNFSWKAKSLKKHTPYMIYVKAYITKKGKKKYLQSSPRIFVFTGDSYQNYTNAKSITFKKSKLSLKKGKTFKIKAQINKVKKNKKLMPDTYVASIRYLSSNKKIASVDKKGKIIAKDKGTCYIYIYSHNGITSKVKVTVK
ncbi:Ig-like domain (group 2) [Acetitomaculum ruminis DSM 5522]|uniref:Ig-like domain (Group 2) n=1 Tax=Acetitomaculum ruminis DSM 5522 TaxID=1120918 RepID=A0A1I0WDH5_9FIRM|nr:Ig-like domain-containing protein [Acetitomaculum ruminis]SFA86799.1 Ig-like domain (group 2) [Acetitomaculum ruminis DSM 5522]